MKDSVYCQKISCFIFCVINIIYIFKLQQLYYCSLHR